MSSGSATELRYEFTDPPADEADFDLDPAQRAVVEHASGPLLVRGGPGTGKTESLLRAVTSKVEAGVDPASILLFGLRRQDTAKLRSRLDAATAALSAAEVGVFTFPAFAFALLRSAAVAEGRDEPRLLTGPEADALIRSMLEGEDFGWPDGFDEAVRTYAFAQQLRDLVLRCGERGLDGPGLASLGVRHDRPEWVAAARFYDRYVTTLAIQSLSSALYDSAEIVRAAAAALRGSPDLCPTPAWVFVDDLQDATPAHLELLELLAGDGANLVAAGTPDAAVFGYQGGDPESVRDFPYRFPARDGGEAAVVQLRNTHTVALAPLAATVTLSRRLRGSDRDRARGTASEEPGRAEVVYLPSPTREAVYIADIARRAHLLDGIPYGDMAVIVKSASAIPQLRRAMQHAGVPTRQAADDVPLPAHPTVRDLLRVVLIGRHPERLDETTAAGLLHSPFGGADPFAERRLRQELRRLAVAADDFSPGSDLLVEALVAPEKIAALPEEDWAGPARKLDALFAAAREGGGITATLWRVWEASGLGERLKRRALSADRRAQRADAELDAVIALFDLAAAYERKQPGAGAEVFCEHVLQQQLPGDFLSARAELGDAVTLTTAHAAHGRQWDFAVVAGAQEGMWPNLRPRGSLLGAEALVDVLDGRADVDQVAQLLDEERRLFYNACTRARVRLLVTAVDSDDAQPSRFCGELGVEPVTAPRRGRPLSLASLTARLREVVVDSGHRERDAAAAALRKLTEQGVPGADPARWWGLAEISDERALALAGETIRISPSQVELTQQCGLRWALESHGADAGDLLPRHLGTLLHAAAEAVTVDPAADPAQVMERVVGEHFDRLPFEAPWHAEQQRRRVSGAVERFARWLAANRRELIGAERSFRVKLELGPPGVEVVMSGQVDRLERDGEGRLYVVDLKTGKSAPTKGEVERHPQLGAYQLAVAEGAFEEGDRPGGAELVYPNVDNKTSTRSVAQGPLSEAENPDWARALVADTANRMAGPVFEARNTSRCDTCSVKHCCPIADEGRQVTDE
ncbi:ATP-dependent helicase [Glycomyces sp. TRM65418]|uniref:ATP-dependent helicase n=1 Tax=Glycomyces sp. TRM65418 TaxID=2867006 RepID=UPI001CE51BE8|nr:ATP-dependent DNA helicase [Glycomyces sp. TRM65418]MCC3765699.1 ATP-dependent helicase [Glycomyces sp. TRM65418]QZD55293.1 ATP-dependent helicase [Glycomyces sp. TRM65418]